MIEFFVPGIPAPGGSKKAFQSKKTGRIFVTDDAKGNRAWKNTVRDWAGVGYRGEPLAVPLFLDVLFVVPRPKGHYGTGKHAGRVKHTAPRHPAVKPDVTKLLRSTEDALTGLLWIDDALIVEQYVKKCYADQPGTPRIEQPGALIRVAPLGTPRNAKGTE